MIDPLTSTVGSLEDIILFLLPGFITVLLFFYQIPDRKKSEFTIIFFSVITSIGISYLTSGIFDLINFFFNTKECLLIESIAYGWVRFSISIPLARFLAWSVRTDVFKKFNKDFFGVNYFPFGRVWNLFFQVDILTIMRVSLQDGSSYIGQFAVSTNDADDTVQELELVNPYLYDRQTGSFSKMEETDSILFVGNSIVTIEKISPQKAKDLYKI